MSCVDSINWTKEMSTKSAQPSWGIKLSREVGIKSQVLGIQALPCACDVCVGSGGHAQVTLRLAGCGSYN